MSSASLERPPPWRVHVLIHDGVELLDFAGPMEVLASAAVRGPRPANEPWFHLETVAPTTSPVHVNGGLRVLPDLAVEAAAAADVIVLPGGDTDVALHQPAVMGWVRRAVEGSAVTLSVCTGSFVLAELGLLDGRKVATHHSAVARMRAEHPELEVDEGARVTGELPILVSAGVSAGIDGAMELVAHMLGLDVVERTARAMEYDWRADATRMVEVPTLNPWLDEVDRAIQLARRHARAELWAEAELALDAQLGAGDPRVWRTLEELRERAGDPNGAARARARLRALEDAGIGG